MSRHILFAAAALMAAPTIAHAELPAMATADLNVRSGPGAQYEAVATVPEGDAVSVMGCTAGTSWCQIDYNGTMGWSNANYMAVNMNGEHVALTDPRARAPMMSASATAGEPATLTEMAKQPIETASGLVIGTAETVGEATVGVIGAATDTQTAAMDPVMPPERVETYMMSNPARSVQLTGKVAVGARLPQNVPLQPIPDYEYFYAQVNGQPVLVEPDTRQIVYVYGTPRG